MKNSNLVREVKANIIAGKPDKALQLIDNNVSPLTPTEQLLIESSRRLAIQHLKTRTDKRSQKSKDHMNSFNASMDSLTFEWPSDFFSSHSNNALLDRILTREQAPIVCGVASQVKRAQSLYCTLKSISSQFDKVFVYLNDYFSVPDFFSEFSNVIGLTGSSLFGDIGDVGKFAFIGAAKDYYFTCDDDLVYPPDYAERSLNAITRANYRAAVSWHGSIFSDGFENYYSSKSRKLYAFGAKHPDLHIPLAVVGTGCLAFQKDLADGLCLDEFRNPNMADIYFSRYCLVNNIGLLLVPHQNGEIIEQDECANDSIYKHSADSTATKKDNSRLINELVKMHDWKPVTPKVKSVCLIGRFHSNPKGGIYKSCQAISRCLRSYGISVHELCTSTPKEQRFQNLDRYDVVIVYLPHPHRPDYSDWLQYVLECTRPVIANLSFDLSPSSVDVISAAVIKSRKMNDNLYVMCFTNTLAGSLGSLLKDPSVKKIVFPKTLLFESSMDSLPGYEERTGILFGDFAKMSNSKLVGSSYERWIQPLRKCLPFAPLYALKHYGTTNRVPGYLNLIEYNEGGIAQELSKFRLYICLTPYATFEMVPVEAAAHGVPVLSRFMPQSLSEYLGHSITQFETPDQLAFFAQLLYNNEQIWKKRILPLGMRLNQRHSIYLITGLYQRLKQSALD